jgi:prevent-host-death family protein
MKTISATGLRNNIFKLLDEVLKTKQPLIVNRKGQKIRIEVEKKESPTQSLFSKPIRKGVVSGDSEELVNVKVWEWSEVE